LVRRLVDVLVPSQVSGVRRQRVFQRLDAAVKRGRRAVHTQLP
jgi:hypothetical protein